MVRKWTMACALSIVAMTLGGAPCVYSLSSAQRASHRSSTDVLVPLIPVVPSVPSSAHKFRFELYVDFNTMVKPEFRDGSFGRPFRRIQEGVDFIEKQPLAATTEAYTLYIAGGPYPEEVRIHGDGKNISFVGLGQVSVTNITWMIGEKTLPVTFAGFAPKLSIKTINNVFRNGNGIFGVAGNIRTVHRGKIESAGQLEICALVGGNLTFKTRRKNPASVDLFLYNAILGTPPAPGKKPTSGKVNSARSHGVRLQIAKGCDFNARINVDDYNRIESSTINAGMKLLSSSAGTSAIGILNSKLGGTFYGRKGSQYRFDCYSNYWATSGAVTITGATPVVLCALP